MDPTQETTDNSPERPQTSPLARRAVAIVSDIRAETGAGQSLELNSDAHIIINSEADVQGDGVDDGIVALEPNDDFAMGAPPGAPGAIETTMTLRPTDTAVRPNTAHAPPSYHRRDRGYSLPSPSPPPSPPP